MISAVSVSLGMTQRPIEVIAISALMPGNAYLVRYTFQGGRKARKLVASASPGMGGFA